MLLFVSISITAQTGNVGIGTSIPLKPLHIVKGVGSGAVSTGQTTLLVDADASHYISLMAPFGQETGILNGRPGTSIRSGIVFDFNAGIRFRAGGNVTRVLLDSVGKLGIGTAIPEQKLDVNGKIKLGDDVLIPVAGTIRWNAANKDFEGFDGDAWISFTKAGIPLLGDGSSGPVSNYTPIFPNDINQDKAFGFSVDIDSNYAIIGATKSNYTTDQNTGAAYIFTKSTNGTWLQQAKLLPDATDNQGIFGYRVSIFGEYAAVSDFVDHSTNALNNFTAQVYIFKRTGTTWVKQVILNEVPSAGGVNINSDFGADIDLDSTHLVVGAPMHNTQTGAAFVYQRTGTIWSSPVTLPHQLTNTDVSPHFGTSVSIYNNEIIVGSPDETDLNAGIPNSPYGRVYLYRKQAGVWNNIFDIMPTNFGNTPTTNSNPLLTKFGSDITLYDKFMIVSAPENLSTFIYAKDGSGEIRLPYAANTVSMYDNRAVVVSNHKAYVFKRTGSSWNLYAYYPDPDHGDPTNAVIWDKEIIMGIPSFIRCAGTSCFNTGKASFVTAE
jgi:hypothetical protein